jgi:hypothetical protein
MLPVSQRLGDFEIVRLLGKGGMGEVYEAQQLNPPRRVALKVLAPWLADSPEALERFEREAAVPAQLDHPGIVRIVAAGRTDDGHAWYTMQLVRGVSLAHVLKEAGRTPQPVTVVHQTTTDSGRPPRDVPAGDEPSAAEGVAGELLREYHEDRFRFATWVGIHAGRALAAAHRHGVLHRDVKPSNLMIDRHHQLYVVDFGLTRALAPGGSGTRPGVVCGTPWYMSPEQARGEPLDARSDVFALGVVLYELASGGLGPYAVRRDDHDAVLQDVRAGRGMPLRSLAPDVPPALERVIRRAMEARPGRRYQVAEEMVADLERFDREGGRRITAGKPRRRWGLSGKWLLGVVLVSGLLVLGAAGLSWLFGMQAAPGGHPSGAEPAVSGPAAPPAEGKRDGAAPPLPDTLRTRLPGQPLLLFLENGDPLWGCRLFGEGKYHPLETGSGVELYSPPGGTPTLLALDDDLQRRGFEFAVELRQSDHRFTKEAYSLGVFFGWHARPLDRERFSRFLVLRLEEYPHGHGDRPRLDIGTSQVMPARGARGESVEWCHSVRGIPALELPPRPPSGWRQLRVRAVQDTITITADSTSPVSINLGRLRTDTKLVDIDPHGALGIWAADGVGSFRNARVVVFPGR